MAPQQLVGREGFQKYFGSPTLSDGTVIQHCGSCVYFHSNLSAGSAYFKRHQSEPEGEPLFDNDNNDIANGGVHGALLWLYGHDPFPETRSVETKICTYIYHAAEILEIADLREYTASVLKCIFQAALNGSFGDFFEILFSTLTTDPDAKRAVMGVVGEFCREHIAELQDHSDFRAYFEDYPELAMAILDFVAAVMKAKV